jgi:hypothetical protein
MTLGLVCSVELLPVLAEDNEASSWMQNTDPLPSTFPPIYASGPVALPASLSPLLLLTPNQRTVGLNKLTQPTVRLQHQIRISHRSFYLKIRLPSSSQPWNLEDPDMIYWLGLVRSMHTLSTSRKNVISCSYLGYVFANDAD